MIADLPVRAARRRARRFLVPRPALLAVSLLLAGCHSLAPRLQPDSQRLALQQARESMLAARHDWTLRGRLGLSDGQQGGSGSFVWVQHGGDYDFQMRKPFTGGLVFRLQGGPAGARLEIGDGHTLRDADVESLMRRALGWTVPLQELRAWVLGMRATGAAAISFQPDGLPATISQDGWQIAYPGWNRDLQPALPRQVFASRPPYRVRLSIEDWQFGAASPER